MPNLRVQKLTEDEVQKRLTQYAGTHDEKLRDDIVLQYSNLVESIARRFTGAGEPVDDLVQEGYIGLITAVDLYDASKGVKFSTYATHFVIGQIKHYLRDKGKIIKEPAWLQELNQRMGRIIESLSHQLGRQPTDQEIGDVMGLSEDAVADLLTTREVFKVTSLDGDRDDSTSFPVDADKIKAQRWVDLELPIEDKLVLKASLERLKTIEQTVINHFFYLDLNQTEIAKKLGISCNYVSHILRNSTKKLKKILMTEELKDAQIQLHQMNKRLRHTAMAAPTTVVDSTTGLYSRSYFTDRLDEEITRACRYKHSVGAIFVKFGLKSSSPSAACLRTENVLTKIADTVRDTARKLDVVTRYDDDIFALILPHTGAQSGAVAKRIEDRLRGLDAEFANSRPAFTVDLQVAWASYPDDAATASELMESLCSAVGATQEQIELPRAA
ncbi:MAG: sigma-70 family RNA polymerase sigma factor [Armatimonadota bacterium]|nr:sigma-70 family RNA polymerase sigma factor [Armatimonadota bacterium]